MITLEPPRGLAADVEPWTALGLSRSGLTRFVREAQRVVGLRGSVDVLLADDRTLRRLNRDFRGKDKATDVLSFPAAAEVRAELAGDMAISVETAARQAKAHGHSLRDEVRVLLLHGLLHLSGMDHETDRGEMAVREAELRKRLRLKSGLIARVAGVKTQLKKSRSPCTPASKLRPQQTSLLGTPVLAGNPASGMTEKKDGKQIPFGNDKKKSKDNSKGRGGNEEEEGAMSWGLTVVAFLCLLPLASYADEIYTAMGKFLSREYADNVEAWERAVEPRLRLSRESAAVTASVLRQIALVALAFLLVMRLHWHLRNNPTEIARTVFELLLVLVFFDRLIPQMLFTRTRGWWVRRIVYLLQALFYVVLPVTLTIGLLLSIVGLAEKEELEPEHPSEAVDALLEAGEEEGILEESDRELVRSVVEFGDKVVREVMTPRPQIFAVPQTMTLTEFTREVREHGFSRVPVYGASMDEIVGIAFARDLLDAKEGRAERRTVRHLARPAMFVPETKKVNELLREMQREKQHMSVVIDEYGNVAGLVTIEDLLEAIVGNIEDEHDTRVENEPVAEPGGSFVVPGSFDVSRLRGLFGEPQPQAPASEAAEAEGGVEYETREQGLPQLLTGYEATTVGGLVSEIAGHIPLPGEVVEDGPLRMEVLESTDRKVERVRVMVASGGSEPE